MNTIKSMYKWETLPWKKIEWQVFKLQKRIYQASSKNDMKSVHRLQKLLLKSQYAKFLVVKKVAQVNKGKHTAGIDGVKSLTNNQKYKLALNLKLPEKASPTRRIWIPKLGNKTEKRPLSIPTMRNRAEQALLKFALEPEWEAKFEANTYGFRPGRSTWDAIEAIFITIKAKPKYVLDADIAKCFDRINHDVLLKKMNTFGKIRKATKAFLTSGFMDGDRLFPTAEGTPQGSIVSPLLANIALYGFQTFIRDSFPAFYKGNQGWKPYIIMYADDFVILHHDQSVIEKSRKLASEWLSELGLELKDSKTRISHTLNDHNDNCGFDFLGFQIRQFPVGKTHSGKLQRRGYKATLLGFKTIISPSKKAQMRHLDVLKDRISRLRSVSQEVLIAQLNPVIRGWCNYYSTVCSKEIFIKVSHKMVLKLLKWANRRHPNKGSKWIVRKYWRLEQGSWNFAIKGGIRLRNHQEVAIKRHIKIRSTKSPFDGDWKYWNNRGTRTAV
ncbi:MAG: reverse transcriptase domain-containing protein [Spirochaetaceae bacterium]|jgi:RNA-directed DNA polymerase|nr:reverse transcriptase domain-containing protein [Spirochaetaceae bacterium]